MLLSIVRQQRVNIQPEKNVFVYTIDNQHLIKHNGILLLTFCTLDKDRQIATIHLYLHVQVHILHRKAKYLPVNACTCTYRYYKYRYGYRYQIARSLLNGLRRLRGIGTKLNKN